MEPDETTAQDVIDTLRIVLMAQKDPAEMVKIVSALVDMAPEADSNRGVQILLDMITEGSLKVALVDA
jgi:hypothetical protein